MNCSSEPIQMLSKLNRENLSFVKLMIKSDKLQAKKLKLLLNVTALKK